MQNVLFLAHPESDGSLPAVAKEALAVALELSKGAKLFIGLIGH